jgi:hypothetical protein
VLLKHAQQLVTQCDTRFCPHLSRHHTGRTQASMSSRHTTLQREYEVSRNVRLHSVKRIHLTPVPLQQATCLH